MGSEHNTQKTLTRRDFLRLFFYTTGAALAVSCAPDGPRSTQATPEKRTFSDGEIIALGIALAGDGLSEEAIDILYSQGFRGERVHTIGIDGREETGWWKMKGSLKEGEGNFAVYYHPEKNVWLKVAPGKGLNYRLEHGREALIESMRVAQIDESTIDQVRLTDIVMETSPGIKNTLRAMRMPHFGSTLGWMLRNNVNRDVISEYYQRAFVQAATLARTKHILQRDPNLGNVIRTPDGKIFVIDFENTRIKTQWNTEVRDFLWSRFMRVASQKGLTMGAESPEALLASSGFPTSSLESGTLTQIVSEEEAGLDKVIALLGDDVHSTEEAVASDLVIEGEIINAESANPTSSTRLLYWVKEDGRQAIWTGLRDAGLLTTALLGVSMLHEGFDPQSATTLDMFEPSSSSAQEYRILTQLDTMWEYGAKIKWSKLQNLRWDGSEYISDAARDITLLQKEYGVGVDLSDFLQKLRLRLYGFSTFGSLQLKFHDSLTDMFPHDVNMYVSSVGDDTNRGVMFWYVENFSGKKEPVVAAYYEKTGNGWKLITAPYNYVETIQNNADGTKKMPAYRFATPDESGNIRFEKLGISHDKGDGSTVVENWPIRDDGLFSPALSSREVALSEWIPSRPFTVREGV